MSPGVHGETSGTFGERYKEHLKEPSPIHAHSTQRGYSTTMEDFNIIGRDTWPSQNYQEINIHKDQQSHTNRNVGKYNLHHIWDRVLLNTPNLKINNDNRHAPRTSLSGHVQSIPTNRHLHRTIRHTGHALNFQSCA